MVVDHLIIVAIATKPKIRMVVDHQIILSCLFIWGCIKSIKFNPYLPKKDF